MNKTYVLDANAILSYVEEEPGAVRMEKLFKELRNDGSQALISAVNFGEVFYYLWLKYGEESARRTIANLNKLAIETVIIDGPHAMTAAEIRVRHKIPYVDCLAAALAVLRHGVLVTSDRDFEKLGHRVQVLWIAHS